MAKKKIFSILTTLADFISDSFIKQRGIRTDGNKNWMFKDGVGDVHVVADQIVTDGSVTSYPENHFSPPVLHDVLEVDSEDVEAVGNVLCVDDRSSTYGSLKKISLSDLPGTTPVTGNLTATGAISLDQTRQVIGGAAAISHSDEAGYKHVPTGGATGQFLKYGGASGTPAWAAHGLTAADVHALSGYGLKNYIAKFNAITEVQMSLIYEDDDGKVGIGTETPLTDVEIWPPTDETVKLTITGDKVISAVGDEYCSVDFRSGGDQSPLSTNDIVGRIVSVAEYDNGSRSGMAFYTVDNSSAPYIKERVRIDYNGNVGIGTSSPLDKLHIKLGESGTTAYIPQGLTLENSSAVVLNLLTPDNESGNIIFGCPSQKRNAQIVSYYNSGSPLLAFYVDGGTERVRINSDGKVGIGTTTPTALLDVNSDIIRLRTPKTPANSMATGSQGQICWDTNYLYVCYAANSWGRIALLKSGSW